MKDGVVLFHHFGVGFVSTRFLRLGVFLVERADFCLNLVPGEVVVIV